MLFRSAGRKNRSYQRNNCSSFQVVQMFKVQIELEHPTLASIVAPPSRWQRHLGGAPNLYRPRPVHASRTPHARVGVPGTKERGFAMVVRFLSEWEWERGVSVPLYESEEDRKEAEEARKVEVSPDKAGVWVVSTEMDPEGRMWTAEGPDAIVARRVRSIAKASWAALQGMESSEFDAKVGFLIRIVHAPRTDSVL